LRDTAAVSRFISTHQPNVIIHTAASNRPTDFARLIVDGTRNLAEAAARSRARLINLSTDVVFDGKCAPYREMDRPSPVHPYGRAKALAEDIAFQSQADVVNVRTSLIYSLTGEDHTISWLLKARREKQPVTLFFDEVRSPILVHSLASACLELADHSFRGFLHVAGVQSVNRWQLGSRLLRAMGIAPGPWIQPGHTPPELRLRRPQNCTLDVSLALRTLQTPLPGLDQVLQQAASKHRTSGHELDPGTHE
jgi:dTDP-4-dehydrorhamnose reductase